MPRINLLPHREEARKIKRREFLFAVVAAVIAGIFIAGCGKLLYSNWIDAQNAKNDMLKREIGKLDAQITDILDLESRKQRLFDDLVKTVPEGVYLTSIKQTGRKLEIHGIAQSSTRVSTYMRNIDASSWIANPVLQVIEAAPNSPTGGSSFTLFTETVGVDLDDNTRSGPKKVAAK